MSGAANFPTALDTDGSLHDVTDGVSYPQAAHHNNIKEAVKAIEAKLGIYNTAVATSLDYRLGHPTYSHNHDGASGMAMKVNPTVIPAPSGAVASALSLHDHLMNTSRHAQPRHIIHWDFPGSLPATAPAGPPFRLPLDLLLEWVNADLRRGPSGATTALDINIGATPVWVASVGLRPIFPAGATRYAGATPNQVTYPSGALITVDVDAVGSNDPGQDLSIVFVFREP